MKALVLSSGGVDSTTCVGIAVKRHGAENVATVSFIYGQRHDKELKCAEKIAEFYGVKHYVLNISDILKNSDSAMLKESSKEIEHKTYAEQIAENGEGPVNTYVPFRNGLMLSAAASLAYSLYGEKGEKSLLYLGAHSDDAAGSAYPDCSAAFTGAMNTAIYEGTGGLVSTEAPLVSFNKAQVVKEGLAIGVPYELTWSCISIEDRVFALSGYKKVSELKEGDYVWGYTDKWQPSKIEKIMYNGKKPLYNVILQDQIGRLTSFKCTEDHRLMMRDGSYKMLAECKVGDKVMPAHPTSVPSGHLCVKLHNNWKETSTYMHRIVAEHFGFLDEVVHHEDNNPRNNDPSNLKGLKWGEHSKLADISNSFSPEVNERRKESVRLWWENMSHEEYELQCQAIRDGRNQNHTIKSIEYWGEGETFDLQTETSNFALEAQLFVHNCYEGGDKACGKCSTCKDRLNAFKENDVEDPIEYAD